jgi:hypothetical protein
VVPCGHRRTRSARHAVDAGAVRFSSSKTWTTREVSRLNRQQFQ